MKVSDFNVPTKHNAKRSQIQAVFEQRYPLAARAFEMAQEYHTGTRKDGLTPEFDHQLSIARFVLKLTPHLLYPDHTLAVVMLHDVPEDYTVPLMTIYKTFGTRVGQGVNLVTKKWGDVHRPEDRLFQLMARDPIASIAKGGDRVHNQSTMSPFTQPKKNSYLGFTDDMIIPMLLEAQKNFPAQRQAYDMILRVLGYQKKVHGKPELTEPASAEIDSL